MGRMNFPDLLGCPVYLRIVITVPVLSPSGSALAAALYVRPVPLTPVTVKVTDVAVSFMLPVFTEQVPAVVVVQVPVPV